MNAIVVVFESLGCSWMWRRVVGAKVVDKSTHGWADRQEAKQAAEKANPGAHVMYQWEPWPVPPTPEGTAER